jgi:hypothetical protein
VLLITAVFVCCLRNGALKDCFQLLQLCARQHMSSAAEHNQYCTAPIQHLLSCSRGYMCL